MFTIWTIHQVLTLQLNHDEYNAQDIAFILEDNIRKYLSGIQCELSELGGLWLILMFGKHSE
jgi:hypothetical protein